MKPKKDLTTQYRVVEMSYDKFKSLPNCPVQRNHKKRAKDKKTREKLSILQPQHCIIASATLTEKSYDPSNGVTYLAGSEFLVDAHTRREFWGENLSDAIPEKLTSLHFDVKSITELRDLYYTFDNSANTEKSADLAYGACRYLNTNLNNHKLYQVTGLTWAAHFYDKQTFPKTSGYDGNGLIVLYSEFNSEIKFLDSFQWDGKIDIPHPLKTASLLFLKKYNNSESKEIVKRVFTDDFQGKDKEGRLDGVTNLLCWIKNKDSDFAANFNTIPDLSGKFLYWLNQAYLEKTQKKDRVYKKGDHSGMLELYRKFAPQEEETPLTQVISSAT